MREYSKITPQFWLGKTGKKLRGNQEAQIVSFYLLTNPHANMLGLYYLPKMFISHETGLPFEGACKGLARCIEAGFCLYDEENEMIWVLEMANYQIGELKPSDNRCVGIQNEYDKLPENLYFQQFYDKYATVFHMKKPRGTITPSEAPQKPLRSQEQEQEQEKEQEQEQEQKNNNNSASAIFEIFLTWMPRKVLAEILEKRQIPMKRHNPNTLKKFVAHGIAAKTLNSQDGWENLYADWLDREFDKPEKPETTLAPKKTGEKCYSGIPASTIEKEARIGESYEDCAARLKKMGML